MIRPQWTPKTFGFGMGLELIIHYCGDSREDRRAEYDYCVLQNLAHPFVDRIHNLGLREVPVAAAIRENPKWHDSFLDHRMTFQDAFGYASWHLAGRMVGICNLDIFLDHESDWAAAEALLRQAKVVLCQSRVEFTPPATTHLDPAFARVAHANAQDAWFFVSPVDPPAIEFEIGTLGCDNALAERIRRIGYVPVNLGSRFRVMHYDVCRGKQGGNTNVVHKAESERRGTVYSGFPEREGCYLVPDFDVATSLDELVANLGLSPLQKYQLICDTMSRFIKIIN
jgi:hypothetical protein